MGLYAIKLFYVPHWMICSAFDLPCNVGSKYNSWWGIVPLFTNIQYVSQNVNLFHANSVHQHI